MDQHQDPHDEHLFVTSPPHANTASKDDRVRRPQQRSDFHVGAHAVDAVLEDQNVGESELPRVV